MSDLNGKRSLYFLAGGNCPSRCGVFVEGGLALSRGGLSIGTDSRFFSGVLRIGIVTRVPDDFRKDNVDGRSALLDSTHQIGSVVAEV